LKDYSMKLEAKVFYEDVNDDADGKKWVEYVPTGLPAPTRRRFDSAAIQIFKQSDGDGSATPHMAIRAVAQSGARLGNREGITIRGSH
jgi:hypothetical protein